MAPPVVSIGSLSIRLLAALKPPEEMPDCIEGVVRRQVTVRVLVGQGRRHVARTVGLVRCIPFVAGPIEDNFGSCSELNEAALHKVSPYALLAEVQKSKVVDLEDQRLTLEVVRTGCTLEAVLDLMQPLQPEDLQHHPQEAGSFHDVEWLQVLPERPDCRPLVRKPFRGLSPAAALPKVEGHRMMHLGESLEFDLVGRKDQRLPHSPTVERPDSCLRDVLQALQAHRGSQSASRVPSVGRH